MSAPLRILLVSGSPKLRSTNAVVMDLVGEKLKAVPELELDFLDLGQTPLDAFNPDTTYAADYYQPLKNRVELADVFILSTPDYHGSMSATLKNFFDHFWREFSGKLMAPIVASHEKGLTVLDQIRTVARQCYAWTTPYGISVNESTDLSEGRVSSEALLKRLEMLAVDVGTYGRLLKNQRQLDLSGTHATFLAMLRPKK